MTRHLAIHVRAHEGRYHGAGDGPPSPFRLFQALIAGAGLRGRLDHQNREALSWLERQPAPVIASPRMVPGQKVSAFLPNNDLDAVGGDPQRVGEIRTATKVIRPLLFDANIPWIYAWPLDPSDEAQAAAVCLLAEQLYQLGRGLDMAWAWGELVDDAALEAWLADYDGVVRRPIAGGGLAGDVSSGGLACAQAGSLESLELRYYARRFRVDRGRRVFVRPPKPIYREVAYESPPARHLFDVCATISTDRRVAWPFTAAPSLVIAARDAAWDRLRKAMPGRAGEIERHLVGRKADRSNAVPIESRVRIVPIPSIGMRHADHGIRRLLVEVPAACPLRSDDVRWAFSGAELRDSETGEPKGVLLLPTQDDDMLRHFGVGGRGRASVRVFRTVTPAALPDCLTRLRIDRDRRLVEGKTGDERAGEEAKAAALVVQALRHACVYAPVESIRTQREPFDGGGARAELFAKGTRFAADRLWHVEVAFAAAVSGPLLIGDGRFLGLGLMAPSPDLVPPWHAFSVVEGLEGNPQPLDVARALRRAVMARVQRVIGERARLAPFFSGHAEHEAPTRRAQRSHLAFAFEPQARRLIVLAPHLLERRGPTAEELLHLCTLDTALDGFRELRAGAAGRLAVRPSFAIEERDDSPFGCSHEWGTVTPYVMNRHAKVHSAIEAFSEDVRAECRRLFLPEPRIESRNVRGVPGVGVIGQVRLTFAQATEGPILLGKTRYFGGGFFLPIER